MKRPILELVPEFTASYVRSEEKVGMKRDHYHDVYELYIQFDGKRYLYINDVCCTLTRGDVIVIQPFMLHRTESRDSTLYERAVLNFSAEHLSCVFSEEDMARIMPVLSDTVIHLDEESVLAAGRYVKLIESYRAEHTATGDKLRSFMLYLLLDTVRKCIGTDGASLSAGTAEARLHPAVSKCISYVAKHYGEELSLDFIARHCNLSKSQFCRVFRENTGTTFVNYLANVRLSKAHRLMTGTDKPLSEIARLSGFVTTERLTRVFRTVHSLSPTKWRNEFK